MKKILLSFFVFLALIGCEKEQIQKAGTEADVALSFRSQTPDAKLWPPDYSYQTFTIEDMKPGLVDDYSGDLNTATIEILSAHSDEAEDAPGTQDGNTLNDIVVGDDCRSIQLRKEKMGGGNGRVYTVRVSIMGDDGVQQADYIVTVPKWAWGWNSDAVDDGPLYLVSLDSDADGYSCSDCNDGDDMVGAIYIWYEDVDEDGYGNAASSQNACTQPEGYTSDNTDCNDSDADEYPGQIWYIDADGDGYGGSSATQCARPTNGYLLSELNENSGGADDCNDAEETVYPGAEEICDNGLDDDCDGDVDEADSDCPNCSTDGLLEVVIDPDFTPGNGDEYILYVHPDDQRTGDPESNGVEWGPMGTDIPGLRNSSKYAALTDFEGAANTQTIVAELGDGDYAAKVCADLVYNGCEDWYLPSFGELTIIYDQLGGRGNNNFDGTTYWSSTEYGANQAVFQLFFPGSSQGTSLKSDDSLSCRCVRR